MNSLKPRSDIIPKKHLGQHFLIDPQTRNRIIDACQLQPTDIILEIGPGLGVLTEQIASRVSQVYAIEKDAQMCKELDQKFPNGNVTVIHQDILKYDLTQLPPNTKVIGNLPYYITSPIIEKVLTHQPQFTEIFLTVQFEFGQRLAAKLNTRDYSALTCFAQYYADIKMLFKISKTCFSPAPKVESCFVHLHPRAPITPAKNPEFLFRLIRQAFQQRRKKLVNALTSLLDKETVKQILTQAKIDGELRPENISLENYVKLANLINIRKEKYEE